MVDQPDRIERLYVLHMQEATRLAFLLTGQRALAEDIAQDAFMRATGRFRDLRSEETFSAYLMKAVVNGCRSHWRRVKVERSYLSRSSAPRTAPQESDRTSDRLAIISMLETLPPRQRAAVVLRHYADQSERQTADILGCSVGTVKTLTSRGLATLRKRLET